MKQKFALFVAGLVFFLIAILHLFRLVSPFTLIVATFTVPLWVNVIGFIVSGLLATWMFYSLTE